MDFKEGEILHINKPYGMTSFGALAFVRTRISKAAGVKRIKTGHAGTLDPLATGVLTLCTGKKTKLIPTLQYHDKEYTATLQLGATTQPNSSIVILCVVAQEASSFRRSSRSRSVAPAIVGTARKNENSAERFLVRP